MKIAVAGGTGTVGRHVTELVRRRGHESVVLTRSTGFDLQSPEGLAGALAGVDAVIDVVSIATLSAAASSRFFTATTTNLLNAAATAGVRHHVALSIVNASRVAAGYYAGKSVQENTVTTGAVPWTLLRATQFHEFAAQTLRRSSRAGVALVPVMRSQPVAAREVAERLVQLAVEAPRGRVADLGGPRQEYLVDMVRAYAAASRTRTRVIQFRLPGRMGAAMRDGSLLPVGALDHGAVTFAEWIDRDVRATPPGPGQSRP